MKAPSESGLKAEGQREVSREEVKTLAIAIGVREAARRLQLNENTVRQWSSRYKWFPQAQAVPTTVQQRQGVTNVTKQPSTALQELLSENSGKIKHNFSKASVTASRRLAEMEAGELLDKDTAQAAKHWAGTASQVHSWEEKSRESGLNLSILSLGDMAVQVVSNSKGKDSGQDS